MTKVNHSDGRPADEGSMTSSKNAVLLKIALVITSLALLLTVVSSAFPDWLTFDLFYPPLSTYNFIRIGIFYACDDFYGCNNPDSEPHDWQKTAAGLQGVGITLLCLTILAIVIQMVKRFAPWATKLRLLALVSAWGSSAFMLVAAILLFTNRDNIQGIPVSFNLSWALIMSTANACLLAVCGILLIVNMVV